MEKEFNVSLVFEANNTVDIMAEDAESAAKAAYDDEKAEPVLCHYCSNNIELGECIGSVVYEDGNEVFTDIPMAIHMEKAVNRVKLLESQLDYLLSKVGVDESGVYLAAGNAKVNREESLKFLTELSSK